MKYPSMLFSFSALCFSIYQSFIVKDVNEIHLFIIVSLLIIGYLAEIAHQLVKLNQD